MSQSNKKNSLWFVQPHLYAKFLVSMVMLGGWLFITGYQILFRGFEAGLHIGLLTWSMYILCVPVAHGRFVFGVPTYVLTKKKIYPELFLWVLAVSINILTLAFMPDIYQTAIFTHFLYLLLTNPHYYAIFVFSFFAMLYRPYIKPAIPISRWSHAIIRHVILLVGLLLFFYMAHQEFIIVFNAHANR